MSSLDKKGLASLKFGDIIENGYAAADNPTRIGVFIRVKTVPRGQINAGKAIECRSDNGAFWTTDFGNDRLRKIGSILADRAAQAERMARMEEAVETAYGILWRDLSNSSMVIDARRILLAATDKAGQSRGIKAAIEKYGSVTGHEILKATDETDETWPRGCIKRSSCARHKACVYTNCPHQDRNIKEEVEAEIARALSQEGSEPS